MAQKSNSVPGLSSLLQSTNLLDCALVAM